MRLLHNYNKKQNITGKQETQTNVAELTKNGTMTKVEHRQMRTSIEQHSCHSNKYISNEDIIDKNE